MLADGSSLFLVPYHKIGRSHGQLKISPMMFRDLIEALAASLADRCWAVGLLIISSAHCSKVKGGDESGGIGDRTSVGAAAIKGAVARAQIAILSRRSILNSFGWRDSHGLSIPKRKL